MRRTPDLVRCRSIVRSGISSQLQTLTGFRERIEPPTPGRINEALERRKIKAETTKALVDSLNFERLALYATPMKDLPEQVERLIRLLRTRPLSTDSGSYPFHDAGLDVLEVDQALVHRLKLPSIWLRIEQDDRLGVGDVSHLQAETQQGQAFQSSSGLYTGIFMLDAYVPPLLAALAPGVWGFAVPRTFGSMIFGLGTCIAGTERDAAELLQLISIPGADVAKPMPALSSQAAASATAWWAARLNRLFGVLSDLAVFTDRSEIYRPEKHLEAILTVEQIFRRTGSMQLAHRDANARRTLMFSVLDSMTRINGWSLQVMFTLSHAQKVMDGLNATIPSEAAEIVLPMARDGVAALKGVQDGFFIREHLETTDVELHLPTGGRTHLSAERATARYLKLLRDATHGHGGRGNARGETAALLAHHNGEIPHDIGFLAYLYLLDMLEHPDRLRRCLFGSGQ